MASLERALDVLAHLHEFGDAAGVTQIGRALDLPKSTVHRLLVPLVDRGWVERREDGRYRPGMMLVSLGLGVLEREPLVVAAQPVLESTAQRVEQTVFLATARAGRILVLDKREGTGFLRASPRIGAEIPSHATAIGKLYLAFAPQLVSSASAPRFTAATSSIEELQNAELSLIQTRGWATNREEWISGLVGFAAPIRFDDRLVGALAMAGPASQLPATDAARLSSEVVGAAHAIEARLKRGSK